MFGEHAAEHRSADAGRGPHAAEIGLVLAALARRHDVGNHGLHDRHDAAAAEALQAARQNQHRHVRRQRAQHRSRDEQAQRHDDHGAAAVDIAQRAEHRRHRGRGQQIGRDHPGQAGDVMELAADGRQRGRDDGLVERGQEHRQHQAHQDGADFALGQRRARRKRRRIAEIRSPRSGYGTARRRAHRTIIGGRQGDGSAVRICSSAAHNLLHGARKRAESFSALLFTRQNVLRQRVARMGASRRAQSQSRDVSLDARVVAQRLSRRIRNSGQRQVFGRFFSLARFGSSAGHCTI